MFTFSDGAVSWYSGKQKGVSTSTTEAEYIALSYTVKEGIFLRQLMSELEGISCESPVLILEDNQGALAISKNPVYYSKTKHIDVCYHFTREAVVCGQVQFKYCPTRDMIADICTKPLPREHFEKLRRGLGLAAM